MDLQSFQFGEQIPTMLRSGEMGTVGTYALHLQCAWRITEGERLIVGSADRYFAAGDDPWLDSPNFQWERHGANRLDERLAALFSRMNGSLGVVDTVQVDDVGGLRVSLEGGLRLDIFPDHTLRGEHGEGEYWRLLQPSTDEAHFIVGTDRIER